MPAAFIAVGMPEFLEFERYGAAQPDAPGVLLDDLGNGPGAQRDAKEIAISRHLTAQWGTTGYT